MCSRARTLCSSLPPVPSTSPCRPAWSIRSAPSSQRAPLAIARLEVQAPPYALLAKSSIKELKDLKGKMISLGGPKDITKIYVERMLAPHGVKPGEFDMVFAGATSARASALQAGAVDAAILLPPFNFHATAAGFNELGLTVDYAPELPFSGTVVNRNWAAKNGSVVQRILAAHSKSVAWFYDPKNRAEAVAMMAEASKIKTEDVDKSYDFFIKGKYFEPTGRHLTEEAERVGGRHAAIGRPADAIRHRTIGVAGRHQAGRLTASGGGNEALGAGLGFARRRGHRRAGARDAGCGADRRHPGLGRLILRQRLAELCRDRKGFLRGRRHQARHRLCAVQCRA